MVAVTWRDLKGLVLHPADTLAETLVRHGLGLSLALGTISYYWSTLQISELILPYSLGGHAYFLVNFPVGLGRMALTVFLIHLACRAVVQVRGSWGALLSLWGYAQLPGIIQTALTIALFPRIPLTLEAAAGMLWVLVIGGIVLLLSLWGLILKLQALKVCYNVNGGQLVASIALALMFYGALSGVERMFLYESGLVPQTALRGMDPTITPVSQGRKNLSLPFDTLTYHRRDPQRGEIVGFTSPRPEGWSTWLPRFRLRSIGRVVGLPGEVVMVQDDRVFIDDQALPEPYRRGALALSVPPTPLPAGHFFILADDRAVPPAEYGGGIVPEERIRGRLTQVGRMKWRVMAGLWPW